jgi:hypothetical protein
MGGCSAKAAVLDFDEQVIDRHRSRRRHEA